MLSRLATQSAIERSRNSLAETRALLVSSDDRADEVVYALVKAVADNFAVFRQLHPALSSLGIRDMVPNASVIPIHPGALKYYRKAGLLGQ